MVVDVLSEGAGWLPQQRWDGVGHGLGRAPPQPPVQNGLHQNLHPGQTVPPEVADVAQQAGGLVANGAAQFGVATWSKVTASGPVRV